MFYGCLLPTRHLQTPYIGDCLFAASYFSLSPIIHLHLLLLLHLSSHRDSPYYFFTSMSLLTLRHLSQSLATSPIGNMSNPSLPDSPQDKRFSPSSSPPPVPIAAQSTNPKLAAAQAASADAKNIVRRKLTGYVGFANLPNQWHRKSVRKGFNFNVMVVGRLLFLVLRPPPPPFFFKVVA